MVFEGDQPTRIEGTLTIKGVSKAGHPHRDLLQDHAHPMLKKDAIGANATTVIKRSDFNAGNTRRTSAMK